MMAQPIARTTLLFVTLSFLAACSVPGIPGQQAQVPTLPPPTAVPPTLLPTPPSLDTELRSDAGGFALRHPKGWASQDISGTLELAASAALLDSNTPGNSMVLRIDAAPLSALADQYGEKAVNDTRTFFDVSTAGIKGSGVTIGSTEAISVAQRSALAADVSSGSAKGRIVTLLGPYQGMRVLAQSSPDAWPSQQELFDKIVASISFFEPPPPPTGTPSPDDASQPTRLLAKDAKDVQDPGFVLRLGGNQGAKNTRFASARGVAVALDGTIYLAESSQGVWQFKPDGTLIRAFGKGELLDAYDVGIGPKGELFVADFGRNAIVHFAADGTLIGRWGEAGDQPGQFGLLAPQRIAVAPDGTLYALDSRVQADNSTITKVLKFKGEDGTFIGSIDLPNGSSPNDIAVDGQGNLYLAETFGGVVVKLDKDGKVLARLGDQAAPQGITAGALDLDAQGNVYVATWGSGILKLAPTGALLATGGTSVKEGSAPNPGAFSLPNGIAIAPDGVAWVSDNSGEYSAVTAIRLVKDALVDPTAQAAATAAAIANATPTPVRAPAQTWVLTATATTEYGADYSAQNVVGPPNVTGCVSGGGAWASSDPNGLDSLEVRFAEPLFATNINVYQNHQPGYITRIDLLDERGVSTQVYSGTAQLNPTCPLKLTVPLSQTLFRITGAKITVDQRSGASWSEIDAVELVGVK